MEKISLFNKDGFWEFEVTVKGEIAIKGKDLNNKDVINTLTKDGSEYYRQNSKANEHDNKK